MSCEIIGVDQSLWSVAGLAADFAGVAMLGFDLVRLQRFLRRQARESLRNFEDMASEYGGVQGWADHLMKQASWVPEHAYSRYHMEDEVSYNARRASDNIAEVAQCLNSLAENVSELMILQHRQAQHDLATAQTSIWVSILGLLTIAIGFALQIFGAWPC
jgi:hypothetical protein